jgi:hypothetical protein
MVNGRNLPDVSEERTTCLFRVEDFAEKQNRNYSSILKMEEVYSCRKLLNYQITRRLISENITLLIVTSFFLI